MRACVLFCGAGGSSVGTAQAGVPVVAACNHNDEAVRSHELNHPGALHFREDARLLDPRKLPSFDVLNASPKCEGHSDARGKEKPHHDADRATAFAVTELVAATRPRVVVVENVPEFVRWQLYRPWRMTFTTLGYRVTERYMRAERCGVPQLRERYVMVAHLGKPIFLEEPNLPPVPMRPFLRLEEGDWTPNAELRSDESRARIAAAQRRWGPLCVVNYNGSKSSHRGRGLDEPIGTLTTVDRWRIVNGDVGRFLLPSEQLALSCFPPGYQLVGTQHDQTRMVGGCVPPPLMRTVIEQVRAAA